MPPYSERFHYENWNINKQMMCAHHILLIFKFQKKEWIIARVESLSSKGWELHFRLVNLLIFFLFLCCFSNPTA